MGSDAVRMSQEGFGEDTNFNSALKSAQEKVQQWVGCGGAGGGGKSRG